MIRSWCLIRPLYVGLFLLYGLVAADADYREFRALPVDDSLTAALQKTAEASIREFPDLTGNLALSVIDLTKADAPRRADYNGDVPFYPASVIKLFFMVEIFHQNKHSLEIDRALR